MCNKQGCQAHKPAFLPIPAPAERFGHVHVDIIGPFSPDHGFKYLLTMIDRTTRWPEAVPIADTMADTVLKAFLENWISRAGIPLTVTSDRGAQFTSEAWRKTLSRLGINVTWTTAYHPQSNGIVERLHRTLRECPALRGPRQQIVDAISPLGHARPPQRTKARHSNLGRGNSFRDAPLHPRTMLPRRATATTLRN